MFAATDSTKTRHETDTTTNPPTLSTPKHNVNARSFYYDCLMKPNAKSVTTALRKVEPLAYNTVANGHGPLLRCAGWFLCLRFGLACTGEEDRFCFTPPPPPQNRLTATLHGRAAATTKQRYNLEALVGHYRDWSTAVGKAETQVCAFARVCASGLPGASFLAVSGVGLQQGGGHQRTSKNHNKLTPKKQYHITSSNQNTTDRRPVRRRLWLQRPPFPDARARRHQSGCVL
jgi:hypothetical protein